MPKRVSLNREPGFNSGKETNVVFPESFAQSSNVPSLTSTPSPERWRITVGIAADYEQNNI